MNPTALSPTPFDLHWRLFRIDFRVQPMFWIVNLIFGYMYVQAFRGVDQHIYAYLGIWLLCAFVSILVHELGHVIAGRIFGEPSNIILHGMGGVAIGHFERLKRWQRIILSASGPALGLALFAFVEWGMPPLAKAYEQQFNAQLASNRWYKVIANPMDLPFIHEGDQVGTPGMLVIMNLIWNLFNLLPIIPLDGGMIMREVVSAILPRQGPRFAYGLSFLFAGSIAFYSLMKMWRPSIPYPPLDPLFSALMFAWIAWSSFTAMRAEEVAEAPRRWRAYEERDW